MAVFDRSPVRCLVSGKCTPVQKYTSNWVMDPQAPPRRTHTGVSPALAERHLCFKQTVGPAPCPASARARARMLTAPLPPEPPPRVRRRVVQWPAGFFHQAQRRAPLATACGAVRPLLPWYADPLRLPLPDGAHAQCVSPPAPLPACYLPCGPKPKHTVTQFILDVVPCPCYGTFP